MHPSLKIGDIIILLASELVNLGLSATAVSFACCCRAFEDPVLDMFWRTQDQLIPLLKCLPQEAWTETDGHFNFERIPTKAEWTGFRKHARRMRKLQMDVYYDPATPENLLPLQLCTANEPLLPRLKSFECPYTTEDFIPFIPLFLSPQTTEIDIEFRGSTLVVASMLTMLPTLCPNLERIVLGTMDIDPILIDAVSEMLLACNRDTLRDFPVEFSITEEAREVLCRLPKLTRLSMVFNERTPLPPLSLPSVTSIDISYEGHPDWLQGFCGAALDKLEEVTISGPEPVGDFLKAFESVALPSSIQNSLLRFRFSAYYLIPTTLGWDLDFSPLLSFNQLKVLEIEYYCNVHCASGVKDSDITTLVRAMPKLEVLRLGRPPCKIPSGATVRGLVALASCCLHLSELQIHFRGDTLVDGAAMDTATANLPINKPPIPGMVCALTHLNVGRIPIPAQSAETVARVLLRIFPRILEVTHTNLEWKPVARKIKRLRQSSAHVCHEGVGN